MISRKYKLSNYKYFIFILFLPSPAFAYLDPGSISLMLQAAIAGFAGLIATYKLWIFKIKSIFLGKKNSQNLNQRDYELEKDKKL